MSQQQYMNTCVLEKERIRDDSFTVQAHVECCMVFSRCLRQSAPAIRINCIVAGSWWSSTLKDANPTRAQKLAGKSPLSIIVVLNALSRREMGPESN